MREEFEALGLPPFEERGDVTDEYIRVFKELWTSDDPSFDGKYCSFSNITFQPKPVQKPHIPIWVGGESPRALRRLPSWETAGRPSAPTPSSFAQAGAVGSGHWSLGGAVSARGA